MSEMIEVVIDSIRVSLVSQQRIVILREREVDRYLPIWIGMYEAESITIALQDVAVSRPLTHDLIKNIFQKLEARVIRIEVVSLKEDTFFGNIIVESEGRTLRIDSRPSDALAIAVRMHVPILVARSVMDSAGITPEEDLGEEESEEEQKPQPPRQESKPESAAPVEDRLSIFSDFLDKIDFSERGKKSDRDADDSRGSDDPDSGDDDIDKNPS